MGVSITILRKINWMWNRCKLCKLWTLWQQIFVRHKWKHFIVCASKLNQQICISPAPGRSSKLTHTGVEIDTMCIPDRLSVVQCSHGHVIGVAFMARFQWREAYVLDNWQLAELPQSGGREFDPRLVHDNLSVPLWVYMRFPVPEHQN